MHCLFFCTIALHLQSSIKLYASFCLIDICPKMHAANILIPSDCDSPECIPSNVALLLIIFEFVNKAFLIVINTWWCSSAVTWYCLVWEILWSQHHLLKIGSFLIHQPFRGWVVPVVELVHQGHGSSPKQAGTLWKGHVPDYMAISDARFNTLSLDDKWTEFNRAQPQCNAIYMIGVLPEQVGRTGDAAKEGRINPVMKHWSLVHGKVKFPRPSLA